jgi:hypothetical protein
MPVIIGYYTLLIIIVVNPTTGLAVGGPLNGKCFNINMTTRNS